MVPSAFVSIPALPLNPNGKVDRRALPDPQPAAARPAEGPRTPVEALLLSLWKAVLGREDVGLHDHFFDLGGDSILAIQVAARAHQAGLGLQAGEIYRRPTIAQLAQVTAAAPAAIAEQGELSGPVPLTPIQRWFCEQPMPSPEHWNLSVLLEMRRGIAPEEVERAFVFLLARHDALRLRFSFDSLGTWAQSYAPFRAEEILVRVDLSALDGERQRAAEAAAADRLQASLDLERGPLLRLGWFATAADAPGRLLIVIHHLAVDGVSWRILLEDFQAALAAQERGEPLPSPEKTTSFRQWSERLAAHARAGLPAAEREYWLCTAAIPAAPLPRDREEGEDRVAAARSLTVGLDREATAALLYRAPAAYGTRIDDLLLTALVQAFAPWTGEDLLLVSLEGHGREPLFADADVSRTVGWFTSRFPVWLDIDGIREPGAAIRAIKEQLRAVPGRGIGYGLLRYLGDPETAAALAVEPEVSFNYLGQFDPLLVPGGAFRMASGSRGAERDPASRPRHLLTVDAMVVDGRLTLEWGYSLSRHAPATVAALAERHRERLQALIDHCLEVGTGGYTPSDFPEAEIDQDGLDDLLDRLRPSRVRSER